ncbi:hypothetical protein A9Q91_02325 [Candidatus Gracilibacteria bacterium 28_42_T64]|nr:hypothetical protein A9Q91_02325 [Candidatus Gracilibacteria bacterium 28_42_T64]
MKHSKKATSIVEAMVITLILVTGITGMYKIYIESIRLSDSTVNKIQAIQIAREGIEAMTNIRDTNWILFSSDYKNCWNTLNYESTCIGDTSTTNDISGNYIIYQNNNDRWYLSGAINGSYSVATYRDAYRIYLDGNGFYTQSGGTDLVPLFTREIKINYLDTDGGAATSNDEKMEIISLVQWRDRSSTNIHKVELKTILSNWKNKK